ncbi:MAG: PIN domain-containing protein [Cyanobacteria bacterium P01_D01_bin.1]
MSRAALIDTGPLVAFLKRRDRFHSWTTSTLRTLEYPLFTCEPVITEACFLLSNTDGGSASVMALIDDGALEIDFAIGDQAARLNILMTQYSSVPMSLADACLVRMAELKKNTPIVTFDSDFNIYRMNRNEVIPVVMPEQW